MTLSISNLFRCVAPILALGALVLSMNGTWATAQPVAQSSPRAVASGSGGGAHSRPAAGSARFRLRGSPRALIAGCRLAALGGRAPVASSRVIRAHIKGAPRDRLNLYTGSSGNYLLFACPP